MVREDEVIADTREDYFALAPHEIDKREVEVNSHPVLSNAIRGDILRVARNVGGGGGHELNVKNFKMRIVHKKEVLDTE